MPNSSLNQARKKEHKPKLLGPDIFQWGVGLPREGVGRKKLSMLSQPTETKLLGGISQDFAGMSWGCPKRLRKKFVCNSNLERVENLLGVVSFRVRVTLLNKPSFKLRLILQTEVVGYYCGPRLRQQTPTYGHHHGAEGR